MSTATTQQQDAAADPWQMTVGGSGGGGEYRLAPAGNQLARVAGLFDVGTHSRDYKGKVSESRQLVLVFQLAKKGDDGNNFVLGEKYTWSLNVGQGQKSKFRQLVEAITGKEFEEGDTFDPRSLLGMTVLVNVSHTKSGEKTYHNVQSVGPKPDFADDPPAGTFKRPDVLWSVMTGEGFPDQHNDWLPFIYGKSIQELARESREARVARGEEIAPPPTNANGSYAPPAGTAGDDTPDDDIPF